MSDFCYTFVPGSKTEMWSVEESGVTAVRNVERTLCGLNRAALTLTWLSHADTRQQLSTSLCVRGQYDLFYFLFFPKNNNDT